MRMLEDKQIEEKEPEKPKRLQEWLALSSRANSVFLFGDMFVRDRDGEIISSVFTKRQKQIFCLAIQYGEEGISSKRLSNFLWPEATEEQAKNVRGSTISKFRKTLRRLDDVEFVYKDGRFMIVTGPDFYCDYLRCREIMSSGEPDYAELVTIVSGGRFLSFIDEPIFDDFKEKVEDELIPFLTLEMERRFSLADYEGTVQIADAIFNVDSLNEHALELYVRALREMRDTADAVARYSAFAGEYKRVYDIQYPKSFNEI